MNVLRLKAIKSIDEQAAEDPAQTKEVALTGVPLAACGAAKLATLVNLSRLTLAAMKPPLRTEQLELLTTLPQLRLLDIGDNKIAAIPDKETFLFPALSRLRLANNAVAATDGLKPLVLAAPAVECLDLFMNPISETDSDEAKAAYRTSVFALFPNLVALDDMDKDGNEVEPIDSDEDSSDEEDSDEEEEEGSEEDEEDGEDDDADALPEKQARKE